MVSSCYREAVVRGVVDLLGSIIAVSVGLAMSAL